MADEKIPFLGKKVKLLTKGEIRYEGTLHDMDVEGGLLTLSNVRSFGTEDRMRPDRKHLPPTDIVYERIQFKAEQIKDVVVIEDAVPEREVEKPPTAEEADPAIVSAVIATKEESPPTSAISSDWLPHTDISELGMLNLDMSPFGSEGERSSRNAHQTGTHGANTGSSMSRRGRWASRDNPPLHEGGQGRTSEQYRQSNYKNTGGEQHHNRLGGGNVRGGHKRGRSWNRRNWGGHKQFYQGGSGQSWKNEKFGEVDEELKKQYEDDFDFEAMNAQFNKEDLRERVEELVADAEVPNDAREEDTEMTDGASENHEAAETRGNRAGFFDTISSDISDRISGNSTRFDREEQNKTDMETFGEVRRGGGGWNRRRYSNRGRGGRGYYRPRNQYQFRGGFNGNQSQGGF